MGLGIKIPRNALKKGAEKFKENSGGDDVQLDPGTYLCHLVNGVCLDTGNGPQVKFNLRVGGEDVAEDVKGGNVGIWFSFEEERVVHLFRFLNKLGYDVDDLDEELLEEILKSIEEEQHIVRVRASEKDGYINVRMNKVMTDLSLEDIDLEPVEKTKKSSKKSAKKGKKPADDEEEEEPEEDEEEEDEDEEEVDLDEMDRDELKAFIKENELEVKVLKSDTEKTLRKKISAAM